MMLEVEDVIDLLYRQDENMAQANFRNWLKHRKLAIASQRRPDCCGG